MGYLTFILIYLWTSYALFKIAKKLEQRRVWLCAVPFGREWLVTKASGKSWKWFVVLFIPIANIVAGFVVWSALAKRLAKPGWWFGLLMLVPFVNLAALAWLVYPDLTFKKIFQYLKRQAERIKKKKPGPEIPDQTAK